MKPSSTVVKCIDLLQEVRERTLALITDLDDEQLIGPRLSIVNPLRWEIGHVAWFQEYWVLRHLNRREPMLDGGDALYDSARVAHETRWDLPLFAGRRFSDDLATGSQFHKRTVVNLTIF